LQKEFQRDFVGQIGRKRYGTQITQMLCNADFRRFLCIHFAVSKEFLNYYTGILGIGH
jgi:hypothetical protein